MLGTPETGRSFSLAFLSNLSLSFLDFFYLWEVIDSSALSGSASLIMASRQVKTVILRVYFC